MKLVAVALLLGVASQYCVNFGVCAPHAADFATAASGDGSAIPDSPSHI
jgi:hypothetical protein